MINVVIHVVTFCCLFTSFPALAFPYFNLIISSDIASLIKVIGILDVATSSSHCTPNYCKNTTLIEVTVSMATRGGLGTAVAAKEAHGPLKLMEGNDSNSLLFINNSDGLGDDE